MSTHESTTQLLEEKDPPESLAYDRTDEELASMPLPFDRDLLAGKTAVVSGGGSAIGRATAHWIARAGGQFAQAAIDFSVKTWNAVIDTNPNGTWYMMQSAARLWCSTEVGGPRFWGDLWTVARPDYFDSG